MTWLRVFVLSLGLSGLLAGCSKSPTETASKNAAPDNAVTRYGENLARSEQRAQEVASRANASIARQESRLNQAQTEAGNNP